MLGVLRMLISHYRPRPHVRTVTCATAGSRLFMIISMMAAAALVWQGYRSTG